MQIIGRSVKNLLINIKKTGGRNNKGRITSFHRGGGSKRLLRLIDFFRVIPDKALVLSIFKEPRRSGFVALILYSIGVISYILASKDLKKGNIILFEKSEIIEVTNKWQQGQVCFIGSVSLGTFVYNIEKFPSSGGCYIRAAGTFGIILRHTLKYTIVKMPSGIEKAFLKKCQCVIGQVSNINHHLVKLSKAGEARWVGRRPVVRGVAMNPVDHPHGGGEGKTSGGRCSVTPWGRLTKGQPTRKKKKNESVGF